MCKVIYIVFMYIYVRLDGKWTGLVYPYPSYLSKGLMDPDWIRINGLGIPYYHIQLIRLDSGRSDPLTGLAYGDMGRFFNIKSCH